MPVPQLKTFSENYNVPLNKLEEFWDIAVQEYGTDYEAVSGTVKKMAKNYQKSQGGSSN